VLAGYCAGINTWSGKSFTVQANRSLEAAADFSLLASGTAASDFVIALPLRHERDRCSEQANTSTDNRRTQTQKISEILVVVLQMW
jgi:hypothetical protein